MNEISRPHPLTPPLASNRSSNAPLDLSVKLLTSIDSVLATGESAKAEVLANKQHAEQFQLQLKLTLNNGQQTIVEARSSRPIDVGSTLQVTALPATRLSLSALTPNSSPLTSLDSQQFPAGTLLQARVVSVSEAHGSAPPAVYQTVVKLLNSTMAGQNLMLETPLKLAEGSLLSAQVQSNQSLSLLPLSGRLEQLVLNQQLSEQLSRQGSFEGVLGALRGLGTSTGLSEGLRSSIDKLFAGLPDAAQLSNPQGLNAAISNSGVFLESKLANSQHALDTDLKANLLRLLAQLQPLRTGNLPLGSASVSLAQAMPALARDLLENLARASQRQLALSFPLPSKRPLSPNENDDLETLLKLAAAAISRLQTHQLSSLSQTQLNPDGSVLTTWQLEIPMRNQQDIVPVQVKIQREEGQEAQQHEPKEKLWRIDLSFDLAPLGPLQVSAQLQREQFSSQLWAAQQNTTELINRELDGLRQRLNAAGLTVNELSCSCGTPPRGQRTALEQRWVDEHV